MKGNMVLRVWRIIIFRIFWTSWTVKPFTSLNLINFYVLFTYFAEFKSVLLFRQQHQMKNAFDKSDIYIVCRMEPLNFGISHCEDEIAKCEWMKLSTLITHKDTTSLTKLAARLTLHGLRNGFESVDIVGKRVQSWVNPNQTFTLFHKHLPS